MIQVNTRDLKVISQPVLDLRVKIDVYNEQTREHLDQLECGIIECSFNIDANSDIRRNFSLSGVPLKNKRLTVNKDGIIWLNRIIKVHLGIYDNHYHEWRWYKQGTYIISDSDATFDATTNIININCNDLWANLNGDRNGQVGGAEKIVFTAYEEDIETGEVIKYNKIRDAVITTLVQLGKLKESDIEIDDIGEFKGMPENNKDYLQYREESKVKLKDGTCQEIWNAIPFDQEFSCGVNVAEILIAFRDLYPNYEMYFSEDGKFICKMIPSCLDDDIVLDYNFFDRIFISEDTTVNLNSVKNVCEVWGKAIDVDYYAEDCTYVDNSYVCNIEGYKSDYFMGEKIAIKIPVPNEKASTININELGNISILDENTEEPIAEKILESNQVYTFQIKKKFINGETVTRCYLLGQYQPHAVNILSNGKGSSEMYTAQDGTVVQKYSKEYFQKIYNCKTVNFTLINDSPFSIEELGLLLCVKTGGEYDNISSDSLALARAEYENWKNSRITDSISITTRLCPFADVNIKVSYRRKDNGEIGQYIVKNVSHEISNGTTTWSLMKFYPLYMNEILTKSQSWGDLSYYTWEDLENYTWEDLMT